MFRMNKKIISVILSSILLSGCGGDDSSGVIELPPSIEKPLPPIEPPVEPPLPPEEGGRPEINLARRGYLTLGSEKIQSSDITCNTQLLSPKGFTFNAGDLVHCVYDGMTLVSFQTSRPWTREATEQTELTLSLSDEFIFNESKFKNATLLLQTNDSCADKNTLCLNLDTVSKVKFKNFYQNDLDKDPEIFKKEIIEEVANNATTDSVPSTHQPNVEAVTTPGTQPDLNSSFVSANAESAYQYQPETMILSSGRLTNHLNQGVAGVDYYSPSGRGVTDENGAFTFNWGETISFGIGSFELGSARANKNTIQLIELGNDTHGKNISYLIQRYSTSNAENSIKVIDSVRSVFAEYPNAINTIINTSLSSIPSLSENPDKKSEFISQFDDGLAKEVDDKICATNACNSGASYNMPLKSSIDSEIKSIIDKLWGINEKGLPVSKFHVFHDATNFYGNTGNARGQAAINISNTAIPILMSRNDGNYWLSFGQKRAYDNEGLAYITEAPSLVVPENVQSNSTTFNLPFISLGNIGQGKVMVIGNAYYNSVLRCPNGYSWNGSVDKNGECGIKSDSDDMKNFMQNTLRYLTNNAYNPTTGSINIGTNIDLVYFTRGGQTTGNSTEFTLHPDFKAKLSTINQFGNINPQETPLLILNGFEYLTSFNNDHYAIPLSAVISKPKLSERDITDLIQYVESGGAILIMETVLNNLRDNNSGPYSRLLDSAGLSMGVNKNSVLNGSSGNYKLPRNVREEGIWVYESYPLTDNDTPYTITDEGKVEWTYQINNKPQDKPKLEVARWVEMNNENKEITRYAYIDTKGKSEAEIATEKASILNAFPGLAECTKNDYHYEVNCLEYRPGNKIPLRGINPQYTQLPLDEATAKSMVQAADLGTNITRLYEHELYFRTKGKSGIRLNEVDLNRLYQNMSVWLWNNEPYRYENIGDDELGFKTFTEFLNCYTQNSHLGTSCPEALQNSLIQQKMLLGDKTTLNPSYPLNYMEKPLTRLMLGRSYWDLNIKVDTTQYPGNATGGSSETIPVSLYSNAAKWFAGNLQSTGLWAPAHQQVTVSAPTNEPIAITVALADDLTGREQHEKGLNRPPRVSKTFTMSSGSTSFTVPYGGLIYIKGNSKTKETVNFTFTGVIKAPYFKDNAWVVGHDLNATAPFGEIESNAFIYTTAKSNLTASNIIPSNETENSLSKQAIFSQQIDSFADAMHDFYGRDETQRSVHQKFTYPELVGHKQRFVNDRQISIGAAHSGYPVMNSSLNPTSNNIQTTPLNDWLLWHEVGHNAAEAPLVIPGGTEVTNNVLALYMQDKFNGKMSRVESDIRIAPDLLANANGQGWAMGGAGDRLVMFAQLKVWAEQYFDIHQWYSDTSLPAYYSEKEGMKGWNLYQLMHRKARGDTVGDEKFGGINYCQMNEGTQADKLMLCASYLTQTDLSSFFKAWNPGATSSKTPGSPELLFNGGVSAFGYSKLQSLQLKQPERKVESINNIKL
ncbi:MAG: SslE/AcfD family lipoprotein zinc metalloprotease [Plesiomonas sp.]